MDKKFEGSENQRMTETRQQMDRMEKNITQLQEVSNHLREVIDPYLGTGTSEPKPCKGDYPADAEMQSPHASVLQEFNDQIKNVEDAINNIIDRFEG